MSKLVTVPMRLLSRACMKVLLPEEKYLRVTGAMPVSEKNIPSQGSYYVVEFADGKTPVSAMLYENGVIVSNQKINKASKDTEYHEFTSDDKTEYIQSLWGDLTRIRINRPDGRAEETTSAGAAMNGYKDELMKEFLAQRIALGTKTTKATQVDVVLLSVSKALTTRSGGAWCRVRYRKPTQG